MGRSSATSGRTQRKKADPNSSPRPVVGLEVDDCLKICLGAGSAFSSHCPLDLRAGEANVLELPVAHCLQLDDRHPLDAPREVGHPPRFHSGDQGAAGLGAASFSCRRPKCRAHDHLPLLSLPRTTVGGSLVVSHEKHLAPGIEAMGVTSVTGFRFDE
jgi:hypothetical protein